MKRVAVLLHGQPRSFVEGHSLLNKYLEEQPNIRVDFFFHTWTLPPGEIYHCAPWRTIPSHELVPTENVIDKLIQLYSPIAYSFEEQITFDDSIIKDTIVYNNSSSALKTQASNVLSYLYSRQQVRNLLKTHIEKTGTDYDFVLATRFDVPFHLTIPIHDLLPSKTYVHDYFRIRGRILLPDTPIFGQTDVILKLLNIYEDIGSVFNTTNLVDKLKSYGEDTNMCGECLITAAFLLHFNNFDNIEFFKYLPSERWT